MNNIKAIIENKNKAMKVKSHDNIYLNLDIP